MARAKRHYIPGQIWHLTHRCHKGDFLLKFAKDRRRLIQWLFEAKRRYKLVILNYTVTSNHIHLLVLDDGDRDTIPRSIQLVAGRIGQEFNERKKRKGAFWEDRYHATAVESGDHLARCMVYIDTNMFRTGVVSHPAMLSFSGYNEIQEPRKKNLLIDYSRLQGLIGAGSYKQLKTSHRGWVEDYLRETVKDRQDEWTGAIAVGNRSFIDKVKALLGFRAKGRKVEGVENRYQLREGLALYNALFEAEKGDIGHENTYLWNINH